MPTINQIIYRFRRYITFVVALPVITLLLVAFLLVWQISRLLTTAHMIDVSDQAIAQENDILKLLVDEETGERGYLVSLNPVFLDPYFRARKELGPALNALAGDVGNDAEQQEHIAQLRQLHLLWSDNAVHEITLRNNAPYPVFRNFFNLADGKNLMDAMRQQVAEMVAITQSRRDIREDNAELASTLTLRGIVLGAALIGITLGYTILTQIRLLSGEYEAVLRAEQKSGELLTTTLLSIGDAVLVTDADARITQMNAVAESLTGWKLSDALGQPAAQVFKILNETTRVPVESPIDKVIREGIIVGLANHTVLVRRDGRDVPIDDSGAPIRDDMGRLIGTVLVFRDITDRRQLERDLAAEYKKEHRIAESLQRSLLAKPAPDSFENLEIEAIYRPAWNEALVGGDFFDMFPLDAGKVAMVVGDVSGKGLEAAAKTAEVKFSLRAYLREHSDASSAMARLNEFLCESQGFAEDDNHHYLCLSIAVLDTLTGDLSFCQAGMEPAMLIRQEGESFRVDISGAGGLLLGVEARTGYQSARDNLGLGDILVITTDGITEAREAGGELLGLDRLSRIIQECCPSSTLAGLGECILERASEHAGGTLSDDACVLVARRR